jgi:predicted DNA-binding transcriptional regulator AlpA
MLSQCVGPAAPYEALDDDVLVNRRQLRKMVPTSDMTIWRWIKDPKSEFPKPKRINGRLYWTLGDLRRWWRTREAA